MSNPPSLAYITTQQGQGGIAYVAALMAAALQSAFKVPIKHVPLAPASVGTVTKAEKLSFQARLAFTSIADRPSLIVFDHARLATSQRLIPAPFRRPYLLYLYDDEAWAEMPVQRQRTIEHAQKRLALSRYTHDRVAAKFPEFAPIDICAPGLLDLPPTQVTARGGLIDTIAPQSVVIVARMDANESHKGHAELIAAWPDVVRHHPNAELLIVGGGADSDRLKALAERSGSGGSIRFLGFLPEPDMQGVLRKAAVFVMPSRREGFGLVYLEAMRAGLPCVAGNMDASPETVRHGETGLIVNPMSPSDIAGAVTALLNDPVLAARMGRAGLHRFEGQYRFEHFQKRFLDLIAACSKI